MKKSSIGNNVVLIAVPLWLLSLLVLPVVGIWLLVVRNWTASCVIFAVWIVGAVAFIIYMKWFNKKSEAEQIIDAEENKRKQLENKKYFLARLKERKEKGLTTLDDRYKLVDNSEWDEKWNGQKSAFIDWLEDEIDALQPTDKVYHYSFGRRDGIRMGYVIVRNGKVVANSLILMS